MTEEVNEDVVVEPQEESQPKGAGTIQSVESFDALIKFVDEQLVFRGHTLFQWYQLVIFPEISEYADKEEIVRLNSVAVRHSEIIYRNLAIAKGSLTSAKAKYNSNIQAYKVNFLDDIDRDAAKGVKRHKPSSDILEARAVVACKADYQTLTLAEIVHEFWKCQVDKLQLFNTRLTSLNISKHNDEKYSNQYNL